MMCQDDTAVEDKELPPCAAEFATGDSAEDSTEILTEHGATLQQRACWLISAQLVALALMILVTWRLWFPPAGQNDVTIGFPSIAAVKMLSDLPTWVSWMISTALLCGCVITVVWNHRCSVRSRFLRVHLGFIVVLLLAECLINQHRFLPWAYQSMLVLSAAVMFSGVYFLKFCRLLIVSIYVFSAVSKLDFQFLKTTGRQIFFSLSELLGIDATNWNEAWLNLLVLSFPIIEFLIGIGLLFVLTRFWAMLAGMAMHGTLLLALGPWGLNNAGSVLIWNVLFILQLILLYWPTRNRPATIPAKPKPTALYLAMVAILFTVPLLEKFNWSDHWPAWGLYSPRASRCRLWVADWKVKQMPEELQTFFRESNASDPAGRVMIEFDLGQWCIDQTNAPIYPQDRFQFGIAKALITQLELNRAFRLEIQSTANWLTGKRQVESITDKKRLDRASSKFWMNCEN